MELSKKVFESEIKDGNIRPLYLMYGEEKYELYHAIDLIKKKFGTLDKGVNFLTFDKNNIDELEEFLTTVSFFGGKKLAIVKGMNFKFDPDTIIENADENTIVCIIEDGIDKRLTAYKKISKAGCEINFEMMKPSEVKEYIIKTLKMYNINVDIQTAEYLEQVCSNDKSTLINEFRKITSFLSPGDTLTVEVIDFICCKTLQGQVFDLIDTIVARKRKKSLEMLEEIILQNEAVQKISILLYKQIKNIYLIKSILEQNAKVNIAATLALPPFLVNKLMKVANGFEIGELEKILYSFADYDEKVKIGKMDSKLGLKQILCKI